MNGKTHRDDQDHQNPQRVSHSFKLLIVSSPSQSQYFIEFRFPLRNIRNRPETAGGGIRDIGVYPFGATRFVLGMEPETVMANITWENNVDVVIADGNNPMTILDVLEGKDLGTFFVSEATNNMSL